MLGGSKAAFSGQHASFLSLHRPILTRPFYRVAGTSAAISRPTGTRIRSPSPFPPLNVPLPGLKLTPAADSSSSIARITTLPNGLRVASTENNSFISAVGVFIGTGSRDETPENRGATFLLQRLAFKSTKTRTAEQMMSELEKYGGHVANSAAREVMIYSGDILRGYVPKLVDVLADTIQNPLFTDEEIAEQKSLLPTLIAEFTEDVQTWLPEIFHEVAFPNDPLGASIVVTEEVLSRLERRHLISFMQQNYVGSRIVLAGVGVDHEELVSLASKTLGQLPAGSGPVRPRPQYQGGELHLEGDPTERALKVPVTWVILGFECPSYNEHEFYGVAILHMLLGGGTSFSTGGPGKGMFTRLYTNVLNRYPWIHMAQSFTSCYTDVGLLGVMGTAEPEQAGKLVDVLCTELLYLTMNIEDTELLRAKNQLKTSMFFNLESRSVLVDDIGRQLLLQGRRLSGDQHSEVIDGYPKAELCKLMKRILSSPPTIVAYGRPSSLKKIPKKDLVESFFKRMSS